MKTFQEFVSIIEANAGPSTPVKYDPGMGILAPTQGAGRVENVRLKPQFMPGGV